MRFLTIAVSLTMFLAACAQPSPQGQSASPSPSAMPTSAASVAPSTPAPTPTATPLPSPGSLPAASLPPASTAPNATLAPAAVPQARVTDPPPQIVDLRLDKTVVQSGQVVSGTVLTSLNTASVEARIGGYGISVPKVAAGRFALNYTVPNLPFFLKRTYDMEVIARNTEGVKTVRVVPITIR